MSGLLGSFHLIIAQMLPNVPFANVIWPRARPRSPEQDV
jgi:hypothetical protein